MPETVLSTLNTYKLSIYRASLTVSMSNLPLLRLQAVEVELEKGTMKTCQYQEDLSLPVRLAVESSHQHHPDSSSSSKVRGSPLQGSLPQHSLDLEAQLLVHNRGSKEKVPTLLCELLIAECFFLSLVYMCVVPLLMCICTYVTFYCLY